jgi:hypothetical protein
VEIKKVGFNIKFVWQLKKWVLENYVAKALIIEINYQHTKIEIMYN